VNNDQIAIKIVDLLGSKGNISNYTHCATRLRFQIKNKKLINETELKAMPEIISIVDKAGQYQLVIGPAVEELFHALEKTCPINNDTKMGTEDKKKPLDSVLSFISASISPALPVMVASGLINAILAILTQFAGMQKTDSTYVVLSAVADAVFFYLPVLIAFAGARKLKTNEYIAAFLALAMLHPSINNIADLSLFGIHIMQVKYSSNIIPVLFMVPILAFIDKIITKWLPETIKFILRPFLLTIIMVPLTLFLLGPIGAVVGTALAQFCILLSKYGAVSIGIMALLQPVLILTGMHTLLIPLIVNEMATYGCSYIFTKALAANFAIAGAAIAVGIKSKKKENKQVGLTTGITALLSVTEPAIYGCLIRYKRPFVTACISSGICGVFMGILKIRSYAAASVSIITMPIFIGDNLKNFILACIMGAITFVVSFILTYLFGYKEE